MAGYITFKIGLMLVPQHVISGLGCYSDAM